MSRLRSSGVWLAPTFVFGSGLSALSCSGDADPAFGSGLQPLVAPPASPACGGIAGLACPGAGECVDDPGDDCDPDDGGADCSGVCECSAGTLILCAPGTLFDASPDVCSCVPQPSDPCDLVRCREGTHCESDGTQASCIDDRQRPRRRHRSRHQHRAR